jgi:peptide/nickel transport system substrate-binding protein
VVSSINAECYLKCKLFKKSKEEIEMKSSKLLIVLSLLVLASMLLSACAQPTAAPTEAPAAPEEPVATEAPSEPQQLWTKELRQAVAASIDREAIVDRVFQGRNIPAYSSVPEGYASMKESFLDKYGTRDLQMAKDLLTAAGYSEDNKFEFVLWYPPEHYGVETADVMQVVKEQIEETGLATVELQSQNWAEYVDSFVAGSLPLFILGWFPDFVDEETWTSPWADCEQSKGNGGFYCDEEKMQPALEAARSETDAAKRAELWGQVQDLYAEDVPMLPLFWEPEFVSSRKGVEGIAIGAPFEFNYNVLSFAADAVPASGDKNTIIIGTTDEVNSLDPQDSYSTHDWEILKNTGTSLLKYKPGTAEIIPGTAESYTVSDDGLTYTFKLFPGIKFADGTDFKASEYVTMFNRWGLGGQVGWLPLTYVASVEAPDDLTVVIKLTDAYGFFPAIAAMPVFIPATAEVPDDALLQIPTKLDGIGPYRMVSYDPGQQMVLEANPNYFGADKPLIERVIVKYFADPTTMSGAVESGQIDIAWRILGPTEATRLSALEGLTVSTVKAPALRYLVFNVTSMK